MASTTGVCGDDMTTAQWEAIRSEIDKSTAAVLAIVQDADPVDARRRVQAAVISHRAQQGQGGNAPGAPVQAILHDICTRGYIRSAEAGEEARRATTAIYGVLGTTRPCTPDANYAALARRLLSNDFRCCCYSDHLIQQMVECQGAHLFCKTCVKRYVEDVLFGTTRAERGLPCMLAGGSCKASIPRPQLQRALPQELLDRFERRQAEDSLQQARLAGLARCHACQLAVELDDGMSEFKCPSCRQDTCTACGEEAHSPLTCDQFENRRQRGVRQSIEEQMTRRVVRECSFCKTKIVKEDGCNKVTCRCGEWTCYVCRQGIPKGVGYAHFCQHALDPGEKCTQCQRCLLWEDNRKSEEAELRGFQEERVRAAAADDAGLAGRRIGPAWPEGEGEQRYWSDSDGYGYGRQGGESDGGESDGGESDGGEGDGGESDGYEDGGDDWHDGEGEAGENYDHDRAEEEEDGADNGWPVGNGFVDDQEQDDDDGGGDYGGDPQYGGEDEDEGGESDGAERYCDGVDGDGDDDEGGDDEGGEWYGGDGCDGAASDGVGSDGGENHGGESADGEENDDEEHVGGEHEGDEDDWYGGEGEAADNDGQDRDDEVDDGADNDWPGGADFVDYDQYEDAQEQYEEEWRDDFSDYDGHGHYQSD
eukprot:jgi/Mesvir1/10748/Mv13817-RA.2